MSQKLPIKIHKTSKNINKRDHELETIKKWIDRARDLKLA